MTDHPEQNPTATAPLGERVRFHVRKLQRHPRYVAVQRVLSGVKKAIPNAWRFATHGHRQLPSAVIVGAHKAGTTQLYACLIRHPRCFGGVTKEIDYFSWYADRPLRWYRSRFPLLRTVAAVKGLCLEASPSYLPSPSAMQRMHDVLPDAKVIAILRDPVKRAFSHYQHQKSRRRESRSFDEAVRELLAQLPATPPPTLVESPRTGFSLDYVGRGYYALQLEALFRAYPREQVLILDSADLFDDTNAVCQQVFDCLGVEHFNVHPDKIYNRGYYRETIDPATEHALRQHYRPYDERLVEVTGRRFRWMDENAGSRRSAAA